jgi:hypothetical protein
MENKTLSLGDRYAEIAVFAITVIALVVGWFYKSGVENRSVPFEAKGISAQAPQGWLQAKVKGDEILRVTDTSSGGFGTTYVLRNIPVAADATASQVASRLILEHGQNFTAFRVLEQREVKIYGRNAYEVIYVFVESNPDLTYNQMPSIVRGVDYIFIKDKFAVTASFWAGEKNYDLDLGRFQRFVQSINY